MGRGRGWWGVGRRRRRRGGGGRGGCGRGRCVGSVRGVTDIDGAAKALLGARTSATPLAGGLEGDLLPGTAAEAYEVQDRIVELTGDATGGWKVGAGGAKIQALL